MFEFIKKNNVNFFKLLNFFIFFLFKEFIFINNKFKNTISKYIVNNLNLKKNSSYKNYLNKNYDFYKKKTNSNFSDNFLYLTNFVYHPGYILEQLTIAKYLENIIGIKIKHLISVNDRITKKLAESACINDHLFFDKISFIERFGYFKKSIKIINELENIDELLKFEINNVKIGEIVYDHTIRFTGQPTVKKIDKKVCYFLSKCLEVYNFTNSLLSNNNAKGVVMAETQFIPSAVVFQTALSKGCKVYQRYHGPKYMGVRIYSNSSEVYAAYVLPKNIFNFIAKNKMSETADLGSKIISTRFSKTPNTEGNQVVYSEDILDSYTGEKKILTKKEICKLFNWSEEVPIVVIFDHSYLDGLYRSGRTLFKDNLQWIRATFNKIKKINNVNWIVKSHPENPYSLQKALTDTEQEFARAFTHEEHIKFFPKNLSNKSLPNIISLAITGKGSAGTEYPSLGIPVIGTNRSHYSDFGFVIEPKTKEEYFNLLKNIKKIPPLTKEQIIRAKIFVFLEQSFFKLDCPLIPNFKFMRDFFENNYEFKFWEECSELLNKYEEENDHLKKMLKKQLELNNTHTIDFDSKFVKDII